MGEIPEELEVLIDMLIDMLVGMAGTLEKVRDITFTMEEKISRIEDKINSLEKITKEKNRTDFGNKVSKWLKHTKK